MEGLCILFAAVLVLVVLPALFKRLLPSLKGKFGEELVKRKLQSLILAHKGSTRQR